MSLGTGARHLALAGGEKAVPDRTLRPWPAPEPAHLEALGEVLASGVFHRVNHPLVLRLEERIGAWGRCQARAVSSGTAALHVALDRLRERGTGRVAIAALNWPGALGPIYFSGLLPRFVDVRLQDGCFDSEALLRLGREGPDTALATHLFGNFPAIVDLVERSPGPAVRWLVHDCAQALGSLPFLAGHASEQGIALSGNGSKHLGAGELGLLCSGWKDVVEHVDSVSLASSSRGGERVFKPMTQGYNYRPNAFSAALALCRMSTIDQQLERRRHNASVLWSRLSQLPGIEPLFDVTESRNSFCVLPLRLVPEALDLAPTARVRDRLIEILAAEGVPVGVWLRQPVWNYMPFAVRPTLDEFPNTELLLRTMFHVSEIAPPNDIRAMAAIAGAFEKVWECLARIRAWLEA